MMAEEQKWLGKAMVESVLCYELVYVLNAGLKRKYII